MQDDGLLDLEKPETVAGNLKGLVRFSGYYILIAVFGGPWLLDIALGSQGPWEEIPGDEPPLIHDSILHGIGGLMLMLSFPVAVLQDFCLRVRPSLPKTNRYDNTLLTIRVAAFFLWCRAFGYALLETFAASFR